MANTPKKRRGPRATEVSLEVAAKYGIQVPVVQEREKTLSPNQVAPMFGVTGEAVKQWIYRRRLPAVKLGNGYWRIKVSDLERFIQARQEVAKRVVMIAARETALEKSLEAMKSLGCDGVLATNLADALLKAHDIHPALFLLDVTNWPDAWKLAQKIRSSAQMKNVAILLLSRTPLSGNELDQATELQVQGCLTEPFTLDNLTAEISRLFLQTY